VRDKGDLYGFYDRQAYERQQKAWNAFCQTTDENEEKALKYKIDEYEKVLCCAGEIAYAECEKTFPLISDVLAELFKNGVFHDCVIDKVDIKKFRTSKLPRVRIHVSFDTPHGRCRGVMVYDRVSHFCYEDTFTSDYTHFECLESEFFYRDGIGFTHNYLLQKDSLSELSVTCGAVEWKKR